MKALNNLTVQHRCLNCEFRAGNYFCHLPPPVLQLFESLKITNSYPKGAKIFMEGQLSNGIYMLCQGRVKLSTCSKDGKVIVLRIAEPGEVLGMSAAVSNSAYKATAEVLESCQVNFVRKDDFLRFLEHNGEASLSAVRQLSRNYHAAHAQIRLFGLSTSVADKLAKLLLEWCERKGGAEYNVLLNISYTHEELAEMIGTSRETVTRILKDFRERDLITIKGSSLIVLDKARLEAAIGVRHSSARQKANQA
ncbi:MAG TPA: Crp/Fnr family transcriptional regulator [Pyrinomonadaceae bacterium]|jgi:CRP/FNR family transcriptional regulator